METSQNVLDWFIVAGILSLPLVYLTFEVVGKLWTIVCLPEDKE